MFSQEPLVVFLWSGREFIAIENSTENINLADKLCSGYSTRPHFGPQINEKPSLKIVLKRLNHIAVSYYKMVYLSYVDNRQIDKQCSHAKLKLVSPENSEINICFYTYALPISTNSQ